MLFSIIIIIMKIVLLKIAQFAVVVGVIVYATLTIMITTELLGTGTIPTILFNLFTWGVLYYAYYGVNDDIDRELSIEKELQKDREAEKNNRGQNNGL